MVNIVFIANLTSCPPSHVKLASALHDKYGLNLLIICSPMNVMFWRQHSQFKVNVCNQFMEVEQQLLLNGYSFVLNMNDDAQVKINNENFETLTLRMIEKDSFTFLTSSKSRVCFDLDQKSMDAESGILMSMRPLLEYIYRHSFCHTAFPYKDEFIIFKTNRGNINQLPINTAVDNLTIKNSILIYPMCNWQSTPDLIRMWNKFTNNNGEWKTRTGNIRFTTDKNRADFFIVINQPREQFDPKRTLYFSMEPNMETTPSFREFYNLLKQNRPLFWGSHDYQMNNTEWHLSPTQPQFLNEVKIAKRHDKVLSAIVSDKNYDPGHILRLNFLRELDERASKNNLPFEIHIYGSSSLGFKNYKGSLPPNQKDEGIFPYKYHFNAENNQIPNYVTEKFTDGILGESLMFYWGCPNIENYYDKESFVSLSLLPEKYEEEIQLIARLMENNEYEKCLPAIQKMKQRILRRYNMFSRFKTIIDLSKIQIFYKLGAMDMQNNEEDNQNGQILRDQSFNTIHFFNFKLDDSSPEQVKLFSYMELFRSILNNQIDFIVYPSRTAEVNVRDLYRNLSNTISYYREETEEDVDIILLSFERSSNPTNVGFWMKKEVCEKMMFKFQELVTKIGPQNLNITLSQMFDGFTTKCLIK